MSLLSAFATSVHVSDSSFASRVEAALERQCEAVVQEPASKPMPIAPTPAPVSVHDAHPVHFARDHVWGRPFPVDNGRATHSHHQKCMWCGAVARRYKGNKPGKGVTIPLHGSRQCPGMGFE
eukprot:4820319-Prymnesium_polylepis.1